MRNSLLILLVLATLTSCKTVSDLVGGGDEDIYVEELTPQNSAPVEIQTGLYPNGQYSNTGAIPTYNTGAYSLPGVQSDNLPFGESTYNKRKVAVNNYTQSGGRYYGGNTDETVRITYDANGNEIRDRVFFGYNNSTLDTQSKTALTNQINWLKTNRSSDIVIEGHADERGTREYNLALGDKRAQAVKSYMIIGGINRDRIKTVSYGKEQPAVVGSNEYSWAKNRRSVTVLR